MSKEGKRNYKLRRGSDMPATVLKKQVENNLQAKLNYISTKASALKTEKGAIQLNPNNAKHREWVLVDKYKGQ